MANTDKNQILCRSVFKSGESTTSKAQFTKKWVEMINRIEKIRRFALRNNNDKLFSAWYNLCRKQLVPISKEI